MARSDLDYQNPQNRDKQSTLALVVAGVGAAAGWLGGNFWVNNKMRTFDSKVANLTRTDILARATRAQLPGSCQLGR